MFYGVELWYGYDSDTHYFDNYADAHHCFIDAMCDDNYNYGEFDRYDEVLTKDGYVWAYHKLLSFG